MFKRHQQAEKDMASSDCALENGLIQALAREKEGDGIRRALLNMLEDLEENQRTIEQGRQEWVDAFNAVEDAIFIHDKDCNIVRANLAYTECAGMELASIIGRPYWEIFPESEGPLESCQMCLDEGAACKMCDEEITLDSGDIFLSRSFPIHDDKKCFQYSIHILQNITEKRHDEKRQRVLSDAFQQAAEGMMVLDPELSITHANPSLCELIGETDEELVGRSITDVVAPQKMESIAKIIQVVDTTRKWLGEVVLLAADGCHVDSFLSAAKVEDSNGGTIAYICNFQDLRERKRIEQQQAIAARRLVASVELSELAIWDETSIFDLVMEHCLTITESNYAFAGRINSDESVMFVHDWSKDVMAECTMRSQPIEFSIVRGGLWAEPVRTHKPFVLNDYNALQTAEHSLPDGHVPITRYLGLPIIEAGKVVMLVAVANKEAPYEEHDILALTEFLSYAWGMIERHRAEEQIAWDIQLRAALEQLTETLLSGTKLSIDNISTLVLEQGKAITDSRSGYVGYIDTDTGFLVSPTLTRDVWDECQISNKSVVFKEFGGLWGWVIDNKQSLLTNAPGDDPRSSGTPPGHIPIERFVSAPAMSGGELLGQVSLANAPHDYTERDLQVVEHLADVYALAIQSVRIRTALERSEAYYRTLAENLPGMVYRIYLREDNRIEFFNRAASIVTSYSETELNQGELFAVDPHILAEDHDRVVTKVRKAIEEHRSFVVEYRVKARDGSIRYLYEHGMPIYDTAGTALYIDSVIFDQTARKKADAALERYAMQQSAMAELSVSASLGIGVQDLLDAAVSVVAKSMDAETCLLLENEGQNSYAVLRAAIGWRPEEVGHARFSIAEGTMFHRALRDDLPTWSENVQQEQCLQIDPRLLELGETACLCVPVWLPGKSDGVLCVTGSRLAEYVVEDSQYLIGITRMLGEAISKGRSDEELRSSEARLRELVEHELDGVLVLDLGGNILFLNKAASRLLGRDQAVILGTEFGFPMTGGEATEVTLLQPGNRQVTVEMRLTNIDWEGARCHVVSLHDISERVELEQQRHKTLQRIQQTLVETIQAMARAMEKRDPYTAGHQQRVSDLAVAIAKEMGLDENRIEGLRLGGIIHDVGKICVPAEILSRPGKLTATEFEIIKAHPQVGYDIIKDVTFLWPVAEMVYQHHERIDGSGYPQGLKGEQIVLEARILAVADVVEAMASHRPYRMGLGIEKALAEIRANRGKFYDPEVADVCLHLFEEKGFSF